MLITKLKHVKGFFMILLEKNLSRIKKLEVVSRSNFIHEREGKKEKQSSIVNIGTLEN